MSYSGTYPQLLSHSDCPAYVSSSKLEAAVEKASRHVGQYERQMKDLESRLSENLSNFRAIDSILQESFSAIQRNARRAERALQTHVPHINSELDESMKVLSDLAETLPTIQAQVADIRVVYDSGRDKAQSLVADLRWLNTEFYERWRCIIFTSSSPVSWRWKSSMRFIFTLFFIACSYLFWLLLSGAYRAHRHRLVWGERLMS
jgi:ABC-type multidrug transport system fused ATPase/permease subunit